MQSRLARLGAGAALSAIVALSLTGCGGASPEVVTPTPSPEITEAPTEAPTDTPAATDTPSAAPTASPTPTAEVTPSMTPAPGSICVGSEANKQFFTDAARALKTQVYCAGTLPAHWWLQSGKYAKGILTLEYKKTVVSVMIAEGPLTAAQLVVPQAGSFIENAPFADRTGAVGLQDGSYYMQVLVGGSTVYQMTAPQAVGLATFKAIAAQMEAVPEP